MGERRVVYRVMVGKPEGKGRLGRPRLRCEGNIKLGAWTGSNWLRTGTVGGQL